MYSRYAGIALRSAGSTPNSTPRPYTVCASVTVGLPVAQDQRDVDDMVKAFGIAQSLTDVSQHVANARDMLPKLRHREVADCYLSPLPPIFSAPEPACLEARAHGRRAYGCGEQQSRFRYCRAFVLHTRSYHRFFVPSGFEPQQCRAMVLGHALSGECLWC